MNASSLGDTVETLEIKILRRRHIHSQLLVSLLLGDLQNLIPLHMVTLLLLIIVILYFYMRQGFTFTVW